MRSVETKIANKCDPCSSAIAFFTFETDAKQTSGSQIANSDTQDLIETNQPSCNILSFVDFATEILCFMDFQPPSLVSMLSETLPATRLHAGWPESNVFDENGCCTISEFICKFNIDAFVNNANKTQERNNSNNYG